MKPSTRSRRTNQILYLLLAAFALLGVLHWGHLLFNDPVSATTHYAMKLGSFQPMDLKVMEAGNSFGPFDGSAYTRFKLNTNIKVGEVYVSLHKSIFDFNWQLSEYRVNLE